MTNIIVAVLAMLGSSGIASIVTALLNRRWKKRDEAEAKRYVMPEEAEQMKRSLNAVSEALKVLMAHEIRCIGSSYIFAQKISLEDKETLDRMYKAYLGLPGANGLCGTVMEEVSKLRVVSEDIENEQERIHQ